MDQVSVLLQQHISLLQERCEHLEKNICAVSNANAALEKAASISSRLQASRPVQATGSTGAHEGGTAAASRTQRQDGASTAGKAGQPAGGRGKKQSRDSTPSKAEQAPQPLIDASLCGIQHVAMRPAGRLRSEGVLHQLQQWRRTTAQYFEDLKSAGRSWQVEEQSDMLLLRSSVLQQQQQAMESAAAFCRGSPRNALICAIEVSYCVRKCAQELEEAYVAGADHADLASAAHSIAELFAARQHLLDLGQGNEGVVADKLRQHAGAIASSASPRAHPRFTCASGGMHAAVAGGEPAALQEGIVGQCAALHQIGYAWLHLAVHGRSDDMWPVSSQALPGMSWIPDDAWRMVAACENELLEGELVEPGPVGVVFQNDREAKVWITVLMQLQRLAWELRLMETSGVQLSEATFELFRLATPNTQAGNEQAQSFAALRALHALLLPARGPTLSIGIKS